MSFKVEYNNDTGIVESTFSDSISIEELYMETNQCIAIGKEHSSIKFLCDASNATVDISIFYVIELAKVHNEEKLPRNAKIAVVQPIENRSKQFANFYETACINRGWNAKVFPNRQLALKWLLDSPPIENQG